MKALLDIGRTKLTIDLTPIARDPRVEDVRRFCSLLMDDRLGRSHYSTLLYARIEPELSSRPKLKENVTDDIVINPMPTPPPSVRATPLVRNLRDASIARRPAPAAFFTAALSARGSPPWSDR